MSNEPVLTVGVYQPLAREESPEDRLRRLEAVFTGGAARDCDVLICPELYLSGYFGGDRIVEQAQPRDGRFAREVCRVAGEHGCAIVYGYPERADDGLFNSALCAGADGRVAVNHRKNLLPYDYEEKYFQRGREPSMFEIKGWRIGLLVCYEVEFPETVRYHAQSGCHLVVAPTALTDHWSVVARQVIPTRAFENNIFVAYANHAGEDDGNRYLGESVIVSPFGRDLARAGPDEAVITARLDQSDIGTARSRLRFLKDVTQSCYR